MNVGIKRVIRVMSPLPSAYTEDVVFTFPGGNAELRYMYEWNGSMHAGGLRFRRVRAYRFRTERNCTLWHIEDAYDTLVEVEQSDWVRELLEAEPSDIRGQWKMRHFMIYIDSAGAYEVVAESFEWLSEETAS